MVYLVLIPVTPIKRIILIFLPNGVFAFINYLLIIEGNFSIIFYKNAAP